MYGCLSGDFWKLLWFCYTGQVFSDVPLHESLRWLVGKQNKILWTSLELYRVYLRGRTELHLISPLRILQGEALLLDSHFKVWPDTRETEQNRPRECFVYYFPWFGPNFSFHVMLLFSLYVYEIIHLWIQVNLTKFSERFISHPICSSSWTLAIGPAPR